MSNPVLPNSLKCLRKIFLEELGLDDERVNIWNQKFDIPTDENLFIVLSYQPSKVIANRNTVKYNPTTSKYEEIQDVNVQEHITVGIFSRNLDALNRKEEVLMAMASVYSQQLQEQYSFHIARIAPIENLSDLEVTAFLYRFDIPLIIFSHYQKIKTVEYFDTFDVEVKANDGLPLIEKEFAQPTTSLTEGD